FYLQPFASNKQLKLGPFERSTLYFVFATLLRGNKASRWTTIIVRLQYHYQHLRTPT
ncbi:hypothetical protein L9F63_007055, partial [Diploptera punctata]